MSGGENDVTPSQRPPRRPVTVRWAGAGVYDAATGSMTFDSARITNPTPPQQQSAVVHSLQDEEYAEHIDTGVFVVVERLVVVPASSSTAEKRQHERVCENAPLVVSRLYQTPSGAKAIELTPLFQAVKFPRHLCSTAEKETEEKPTLLVPLQCDVQDIDKEATKRSATPITLLFSEIAKVAQAHIVGIVTTKQPQQQQQLASSLLSLQAGAQQIPVLRDVTCVGCALPQQEDVFVVDASFWLKQAALVGKQRNNSKTTCAECWRRVGAHSCGLPSDEFSIPQQQEQAAISASASHASAGTLSLSTDEKSSSANLLASSQLQNEITEAVASATGDDELKTRKHQRCEEGEEEQPQQSATATTVTDNNKPVKKLHKKDQSSSKNKKTGKSAAAAVGPKLTGLAQFTAQDLALQGQALELFQMIP